MIINSELLLLFQEKSINYDIYVIALQESDFVGGSHNNTEWTSLILKILNSLCIGFVGVFVFPID